MFLLSKRKKIRIKLHVQYDGTRYAGFQRQKTVTTVQGVLEESLARLLKHPVSIRAAGRTDSGVHARGQVVAFDTTSSIPPDRIPRGLLRFLPDDIMVDVAKQVEPDFDPVKDAVSKTYCYRVWCGKHMSIMARRYVLWYPGYLDFGLMSAESMEFVGERDFANFRALGSSAKTTTRNVMEANWVRKDVDGQENVLWEFWVTAEGFLYRMIRLMFGTLLDVGRGYLPAGTVKNALEAAVAGRKWKIGRCAPAKGLCLEKVSFP